MSHIITDKDFFADLSNFPFPINKGRYFVIPKNVTILSITGTEMWRPQEIIVFRHIGQDELFLIYPNSDQWLAIEKYYKKI